MKKKNGWMILLAAALVLCLAFTSALGESESGAASADAGGASADSAAASTSTDDGGASASSGAASASTENTSAEVSAASVSTGDGDAGSSAGAASASAGDTSATSVSTGGGSSSSSSSSSTTTTTTTTTTTSSSSSSSSSGGSASSAGASAAAGGGSSSASSSASSSSSSSGSGSGSHGRRRHSSGYVYPLESIVRTTEVTGRGWTVVHKVNVRTMASVRSGWVTRIAQAGTEVEVTAEVLNSAGETWYAVRLYSGYVGYIRGDLLRVDIVPVVYEDDTAAAPAPAAPAPAAEEPAAPPYVIYIVLDPATLNTNGESQVVQVVPQQQEGQQETQEPQDNIWNG